MHPLPEVETAALQLAALSDQTLDLLDDLAAVSDLAVQLLPTCVGASITVMVDGEPFTVTATTAEVNELDAAQYLTEGPCVESAVTGEPCRVEDVLDEGRWQQFAQAAAAHGVRSSLSVPLRTPAGGTGGALNLYSSDPDAFRDADEVVAQLFGQHVEGAMRNGDLAFTTRDRARQLPQQLADRSTVEEAVGVMVANRQCSTIEARERIESAARRAGVSLRTAAELVIQIGT